MMLLPRGHVTDAAAVAGARLTEVLEHVICAREATTHEERIRRLTEASEELLIISRAIADALTIEIAATMTMPTLVPR